MQRRSESARIVPFETVDQVLAETKAVQRRDRLVPARVTVHLLLAGALFAGLGDRQVFDRMCAGLTDLAPAKPGGSALRQARRRPGAAPMKALSDLVRGPVATTAAQARWRGLLVVAVDGTLQPVPDAAANPAVFAELNGVASGTGQPASMTAGADRSRPFGTTVESPGPPACCLPVEGGSVIGGGEWSGLGDGSGPLVWLIGGLP